MTKHSKENFILTGIVGTTILSGLLLSLPHVSADDGATSNVAIRVNSACSMATSPEGSNDTPHTADLNPGTYQANIGKTTIKTICNDAEGFSIYAIGYTNEEYGNTTLRPNTLDPTQNSIITGTATTAGNPDTSNWAMKVSPVTGTYAPTIQSDTNGSFSDYYSTDTSRKIQKLYEQGLSIQEIGERLDLRRSAVHNMLPYKKGIYKLPDPTLNAEQCQQFQTRKKACENLHAHLDEDCCDRYLWEAIQTFAGFNFRTPDKCRITYSVDCETICFGDLRLTRKEITDAFRKARKTQREKGCVCSPDGLCCRGARELYTVFLRIGACCKSVSEI